MSVTDTDTAGMTEVGLDTVIDTGEDTMEVLTELLKAGDGQVHITAIDPHGPGGGNPNVTWRGPLEAIKKLIVDGYCAGNAQQGRYMLEDYGLEDV